MPPDDREIPISLRGIEIILHSLHTSLRDPTSIRQISNETGLSMRVTKNILSEFWGRFFNTTYNSQTMNTVIKR